MGASLRLPSPVLVASFIQASLPGAGLGKDLMKHLSERWTPGCPPTCVGVLSFMLGRHRRWARVHLPCLRNSRSKVTCSGLCRGSPGRGWSACAALLTEVDYFTEESCGLTALRVETSSHAQFLLPVLR